MSVGVDDLLLGEDATADGQTLDQRIETHDHGFLLGWLAEQAGEPSIGVVAPFDLARRAILQRIFSIVDRGDALTTARARLALPPMDEERASLVTTGDHEVVVVPGMAQGPFDYDRDGGAQAFDVVPVERRREPQGRKLRLPQDLVRVRVSDAGNASLIFEEVFQLDAIAGQEVC